MGAGMCTCDWEGTYKSVYIVTNNLTSSPISNWSFGASDPLDETSSNESA